MAGTLGRGAYALGKGAGRAVGWTARRDWRAMPGQAAGYAKSRPYNLLPWIALVAAVGLWPKASEPKASSNPAAPDPAADGKVLPGASDPRQMDSAAFAADQPGRGREAVRPTHIPLMGWRDIAWRVVREIGIDKLPSVAGGVTFYALLAIFPAIGAFVSLYGLFADVATVRDQLNEMSGVFPSSVVQIIGDQMLRIAGQNDGKLTFAFVISLLISAWSANAGMKALFEGLNVAYDETESRPFFRQTLVSYACTIGALLFLATSAGLLVALPIVLEFLRLDALLLVWTPLRWLVVLAITTLAFTLLYRIGPSRAKARWRWLTWGAALASLLWLGGSLGFSWYVGNMANYDATYGPLGAVIGFMMWVWFSVMTILIGAELNAEIEHQTARDSTTGPPAPMGSRGAAMADTVGEALDLSETIDGGVAQVKGVWAKFVKRKR
ncbi:MAG: YihY/virulence factor BrkB family protein [Caulobacter sp.]|nr:YihY/virulence factor BrkB family protein [Caulobacter sp.]